MPSWSTISLVHLIGLMLAVGAATAKTTLLLRCRADPALLPAYLADSRPITRLIIAGLVLLTLSGVGALFVGYPLTPLLIAKLVLVAIVWTLGPIIDNVAEPKFRKLAPGLGESPSPDFLQAQRRYVLLELSATGLFYVIVLMWKLA